MVALVIGASRGLGFEVARYLREGGEEVIATVRSPAPELEALGCAVVSGIELNDVEDAATRLAAALQGKNISTLYFVAGYFTTETFENMNYSEEIKMINICALAPLHVIGALVQNGVLKEGSKIVFITSEGGSIGLRTEKEGGLNYGHHASKCAANMVGRLLAWDLKPRGVAVVMVHPGFLRTSMTRHYAHLYDELGAVDAAEAVPHIVRCAHELTLETTGRFVAALGSRGLGLGVWALPDPDALKEGGDLPW